MNICFRGWFIFSKFSLIWFESVGLIIKKGILVLHLNAMRNYIIFSSQFDSTARTILRLSFFVGLKF